MKKSAYHHGDLRRALLDAALDNLRQGDETLSFRSLAASVGVAPSAPYHHFRDRGELLAVIAGEGFALLRSTLASARQAAPDAQTGLGAMTRAYVRFGRTHMAHYRVMFLPIVTEPANVEHVHPPAEACFQMLVETLIAISPHDPARALRGTRAIWSALHGLVLLGQTGGPLRLDASGEAEENFIDWMVTTLADLSRQPIKTERRSSFDPGSSA